jgi:hypothetical protein
MKKGVRIKVDTTRSIPMEVIQELMKDAGGLKPEDAGKGE